MNTWEVLRELTENPTKRFTYPSAKQGSYVTREGDRVVWRGEGQEGQELWVHLGDGEWYEVLVPVTFMEAVESGCKIRCEGERYRQYYFRDLNSTLINLSGCPIRDIRDIILNGKWYIE